MPDPEAPTTGEAGRAVAFGPFVVDAAAGTLSRDGALLPVGRRAVLLLAALAERPGQVRSKAELLDAAWPGLSVEESNLSVQMAALRKSLGARPGGGEWIATVPRVGYRLLADPGEAAGDAAATVVPTLAVLPFEAPAEDAYFADGLVEEIITALSRFRSFSVVAKSASFVHRGGDDARAVASALGVRYVLEGSVRRSGDRLRITARLVDGASAAQLFADRFEGMAGDVFDAQDRIAEHTIGVVEPAIRRAEIERSRRKRPDSLGAFDLYLRALAAMDNAAPEGEEQAYAFAARAIAIEPGHGPFLAAAIWALTRRLVMGRPALAGDDRAEVLRLVDRAVAAADGDAAVLAQCGVSLILVGGEPERGLRIVRAAAEANPNGVLPLTAAAVGELHCGELEASLSLSRRALLLSPGAPTAAIAMTAAAHAELALGRPEAALESAGRSLAVNPDFLPTRWILAAANARLGRMDAARREVAALLDRAPETTLARIRAGQPGHIPARIEPVLDGLRRAGLAES